MLRRTRLAETPINVVVGVLLAGALAIVAQHLPGAQRACSTGASVQIRGDWALSPNEDEAAISLLSPTGQPLCLLDLATGVMNEVAHCGECPSWSPMGAVIAFASVEEGDGGLELYSLKTGLRTKLPPSEGYEDRPDRRWSGEYMRGQDANRGRGDRG